MEDEFLNDPIQKSLRQSHHHHSHEHEHHHHQKNNSNHSQHFHVPIPTDPAVQRRAELLLKYENPIPIESHDKKINWSAKIVTAADLAPAITGTTKLLNAELTQQELEEFLSVVFPPIEWEENGQWFRQRVSSVQATEEDLKKLEKEVEQRIKMRHARSDGLCDSRREIFEQCLDEILRQITIENPERGFVLRRLRDELRMTFDVYRTLYESSVAYSTRKSLLIESSHTELDRTVDESDEALIELRKHVELLHKEYDQLQNEQSAIEEADNKRRQAEIDYFKNLNTQLKNKLEKFLSPIKNQGNKEQLEQLT